MDLNDFTLAEVKEICANSTSDCDNCPFAVNVEDDFGCVNEECLFNFAPYTW